MQALSILILFSIVFRSECFSRSSFYSLSSLKLNTGAQKLTRDSFRLCASNYGSPEGENASGIVVDDKLSSPPREIYFALWSGLLGYATYFGSTVPPEAAEIGNKIINTAIFTPFDGSLSPYFVALWFSLGIIPAVYGSLLLPGAKNQRVWALPFVVGSFALGFFGVGPYLGLRSRNTGIIAKSDAGFGSGLFENKITSYGLLASAIYVLYYAITGDFTGEGSKLDAFLQLFNSQPIARISTLDFSILSLMMWEPMSEDMIRRDWQGPSAASFCAVPVLGPVVYLCLRPSLPESK